MEKRWLNRSVRAGLALGLLYCVYLVTTQAIAYWYFRDGTPDSIRKAIRFDPRNPLYYAQLARVLLYSPEGGDLAEVIRALRAGHPAQSPPGALLGRVGRRL